MIDPRVDADGVPGRADLQPASAAGPRRPGVSERRDYLDRLLGDHHLLLRLQASGYAMHEWQPVAAEFARYGLDVLRAWLRNGKIFAKARAKTRIPLTRPSWDFDEDAVQSIATDTVVAALDAFLEKVLRPGKWDPHKGASLKTYFIGQCMWQFPNVYRDWVRDHRAAQEAEQAATSAGWEPLAAAAEHPEQRILHQEDCAAALALLSTETARKAFLLLDMGYTHDEIAREVGLANAKAVENVLDYQRRRLRNQAGRTAG